MFLFFLKRVPFSYKYWIRLQWYRVAIIEWLKISLPLFTFLSVRCSYGGLLQLQALIAGRKTILAAFLQFVADVQASCEVFNFFWPDTVWYLRLLYYHPKVHSTFLKVPCDLYTIRTTIALLPLAKISLPGFHILSTCI